MAHTPWRPCGSRIWKNFCVFRRRQAVPDPFGGIRAYIANVCGSVTAPGRVSRRCIRLLTSTLPPRQHSGKAMPYTIKVNGASRTVDVEADTPLLWVLRDELDLKGTKFGCGMALCGACTVHINGKASRSCVTPVSAVGTAEITTIEAVGATAIGKKVQEAWMTVDVPQCGYCQAGQIMSAAALLTTTPKPTDKDIDE